nr:unnamed protein product [Digitaria exilis]
MELTSQAMLDAQAALWQNTFAFVKSMALKSAVDLHIADTIQHHGGAATLSQIANKAMVPPSKIPCLSRLMRVLTHAGVFGTHGGAGEQLMYTLTPASSLLVGSRNQAIFTSLALHSAMVCSMFELSGWLQSELPNPCMFKLRNGRDMFEIVDGDGDSAFNVLFNEGMASDTEFIMDIAIKEHGEVLFHGISSLIDVAGGLGAAAHSISTAFPHVRCSVMDLAYVVDKVPPGNTDVQYIAGDMFESVPQANVMFLKIVISKKKAGAVTYSTYTRRKKAPSLGAGYATGTGSLFSASVLASITPSTGCITGTEAPTAAGYAVGTGNPVPMGADLQAQAMLDAQAELWQNTFAFVKSMALKSAVDLHIADNIQHHGGGATLSQIANKAMVPPSKIPCLGRLMRVLTHAGVFSTQELPSGSGGDSEQLVYTLTPASSLLVGSRSQAAFTSFAFHSATVTSMFELPGWLQSELPDPCMFKLRNGCTAFELANGDPAFNEAFNDGMVSDTEFTMDIVVKEYGEVLFQGVSSLIDVAGGLGAAAHAISKAFPHVRCSVLDLAHVVDKAPDNTDVKYIAGDMFESVPSANVIFLKEPRVERSRSEQTFPLKKRKI